jgi:hypothetical protein
MRSCTINPADSVNSSGTRDRRLSLSMFLKFFVCPRGMRFEISRADKGRTKEYPCLAKLLILLAGDAVGFEPVSTQIPC